MQPERLLASALGGTEKGVIEAVVIETDVAGVSLYNQ